MLAENPQRDKQGRVVIYPKRAYRAGQLMLTIWSIDLLPKMWYPSKTRTKVIELRRFVDKDQTHLTNQHFAAMIAELAIKHGETFAPRYTPK